MPAAARTTTRLRAAAIVGWIAAAVLATLAPFQAVYGTLTVPRDYADYVTSVPAGVDGWGRGPGGHPTGGVAFGLALVTCAAVFVIVAVLVAIRFRRATSAPVLRRAATVAAIAAPCLLAGVVGALALYVHSVTDSVGSTTGWTAYAPINSVGSSTYSSALRIATTPMPVGGCLWFALGALGCALLAALAQLLPERADRRLAG